MTMQFQSELFYETLNVDKMKIVFYINEAIRLHKNNNLFDGAKTAPLS